MNEVRCGLCEHFRPTRNPDTGRILRSRAGQCGYAVPWPTHVPMVYESYRAEPWVPPHPRDVWPDTAAHRCQCFKQKARQRRLALDAGEGGEHA